MARRSNDKEKRSDIEGLCYIPSEVGPGSSIPYSRLIGCNKSEKSHYENADYKRCTVITATECGDYSGSGLVSESNFRVMQKSYPWLVEIYGSHGCKALAYLGKRENQSDDLIEAIDALTQYPILDDSDHSDLEYEKAQEQWESDGRSDFKRALTDHFDEIDDTFTHDLDNASDEDIDALWWDCTEKLNGGEAHVNEQGDSIHFPIRSIMTKIERNWPGVNEPHYSGDREPISVQLATLAEQTRIHETPDDVLLVARDAWLQNESTELLEAHVNPAFHAACIASFEIYKASNEAKE